MPTMEGAIQQEEQDSSPKTNPASKNKLQIKLNLASIKDRGLKIFKSTKLITVFILFFVFILISVGLIVYSSKKDLSSDIQPDIVITSPLPQNKVKDPQLKVVEDMLDEYDAKVDSLGSNMTDYQPPQMDLNINF